MFLYLSGTGAESVHSLPALSGTITGITSGSISTTMCGSRSTDTTNVTPLMPMTTSHTPSTSPLMAQSHSVSTGTSLVAQGLLSNPTSSAATTAVGVGSPSTHTTYAGLQIQPAEQPFHPDPSFVFPKRPFGKTMRSCQEAYFKSWPWLSYDISRDAVFCHLCVTSLQANKMNHKRADPAFVQRGFCYWKDATLAFKKHEKSDCHREAVQVSIVLPKSCEDVGDMLSSQYAQKKKHNRECLLRIISNLKFLGRQGLPLRGDGNEADSNFMQLMKLTAQDDPRLQEWLGKKTDKYLSHDIQNELLKVMALTLLREISHNIHESSFFSVLCDECTDVSNKEQLVICIRWVSDKDLEVHEEVIGLYSVSDIKASTIVQVIKDTLLRLNLSFSNCRGQCYDGASNMRGPKSGVAKQLRELEPRALYLHCHGHALNLAVGDAIKNCKYTNDALDVAFEVSKLVKFSPKRSAELEKLKEELALDCQGVRVLCPTRWTVRAESLKSLLCNYIALQHLWEIAKSSTTDPSIKSRIIGVQFQFKKFSFLFGVHLAYLVLRHTDNLSKTLQGTSMSASEGAHIAAMTVTTLKSIRTDNHFLSFWQVVMKDKEQWEVQDPELPRKRRMPSRYEDGAPGDFPSDCEAHYRQSYFEVLDLAINAIEDRFDQPDYRTYRQLEELLMHTVRGKDTKDILSSVCDFYGKDFDRSTLQLHLDTLQATIPDDLKSKTSSIHDVRKFIAGMSVAERSLIGEVVTLLKLILVLPSTNAVSERSFSAMRRLKTYLRATMKQERLNHLLLLHVHKDLTDHLSCTDVAKYFVGDSEHRLSVFGRFTDSASDRADK